MRTQSVWADGLTSGGSSETVVNGWVIQGVVSLTISSVETFGTIVDFGMWCGKMGMNPLGANPLEYLRHSLLPLRS